MTVDFAATKVAFLHDRPRGPIGHRIKIASQAYSDLFGIALFGGLVLWSALLITMGLDRDWNRSWIVGVPWLFLLTAAPARAIFMASPAPGGLKLFQGALSGGGHVREIGAKTPRRGPDALSG